MILNTLKQFWYKPYLFVMPLMAIGIISCSKDENPDPINEEEIITTLTVTLQSGNSTITLESRDLDGDGPNPPELTVSGPLQANTSYAGTVVLLNETETPAENITTEVEEEADVHQFFYDFSGSIDQITYADQDTNGYPVGISFNLQTGNAGAAGLTVTLRHEPKKPNDGTLADAGGETDVTQSFSLQVQ